VNFSFDKLLTLHNHKKRSIFLNKSAWNQEFIKKFFVLGLKNSHAMHKSVGNYTIWEKMKDNQNVQQRIESSRLVFWIYLT